jgi:hypothetical protein
MALTEDRVAALAEAYRQARARLGFLDCNLWIGRPRHPEFAAGFDLITLRQRMARYGIRGGVVSHLAAKDYGPAWGNAEVLSAIAGTGLYAGIVLVPESLEKGRGYLLEAISRGARLVRLFPTTHNFSLRSWCCGSLLGGLADLRMPLVLWHTETSWEEIRSLCEAYSGMPLIIEGTPRKILYYDRLYYPLLERYPNLHLELHNLVSYLGIEDIVSRFGARHLLFGSYMPIYDPNAAMMQVTHARISEEDKVRIARANLSDLIAGVRAP